jgi:hypothetical protein
VEAGRTGREGRGRVVKPAALKRPKHIGPDKTDILQFMSAEFGQARDFPPVPPDRRNTFHTARSLCNGLAGDLDSTLQECGQGRDNEAGEQHGGSPRMKTMARSRAHQGRRKAMKSLLIHRLKKSYQSQLHKRSEWL